jgi:hypothetical protein
MFVPPSQMDWTDEKLAALSTEQLVTLFENLKTQRDLGRISDAAADDLSRRITERLPTKALAVRRRRPRSQMMLEARAAQQLRVLATALSERYDLSEETARQRSAGTKGFKPLTMTDKKGDARTGSSARRGRMSIERYISYRVGDSLAGLAFLLFPDQPEESGRYVLMATDDLLDGEASANEFAPLAEQYGWNKDSRARIRAVPASDFAEAERRYEELIARVATALR